MPIIVSLLAFALMVIIPAPANYLESTPNSVESLRSLPSFFVLIEELTPEAEKAGLTIQQLRIDTELRLRKTGIRILSKEPDGVSPYLYVRAGILERSDGLCAYNISVELHQKVALIRSKKVLNLYAATWQTGSYGAVGRLNIKSTIRESINDHVDEFINDYLSVNPMNQ